MNKKVVFLPYDFDTALGINNEGALVFGYNLEDTDQVGGEDVYNGQQSVLWCNLRDMFKTELQAMYRELRSSGNISYAKVEKAFEDHQGKWPEAVFNEDAYFKYILPLIDDNNATYLSMLLGSKTEQRKWWMYNRFRYLDSKYNCGDAQTDYIQLRGYSKSNITITPYADIYVTIKWASMVKQQRGVHNTAYTMVCPLDNVNDTEIYIYSASQLSSLGDLSGLRVGFADVHSATKLRELKLGSTEQGYVNNNLRSVNVGNLKLLRKIDVRNCAGLGTYADQKSVDLSGCTGIEEVYFDGTSVLGVELPNGGFLKKLHLPGTITNLTIRNQRGITEFVCPDFSNITTLFLEGNGNSVDVGSIVDDVAEGCRVRIFNYRWDFVNIAAVHSFLDKFNGMTGMDQNGYNTAQPQIYATVHVPSATGDEIDSVIERYPDITVDADVASYYLRYYDTEGNTLLYTETVQKGQNGTWATQPSKNSDAQYTYSFAGWSTMRNSSQADADARANMTGNRNIYAAYTRTVRTYTITFVRSADDGGGTLQTSQVAYGEMPVYSGTTPTSTQEGNPEFLGWNPPLAAVTGTQTYTAKFAGDDDSMVRTLIKGTISEAINSTASYIASYAFYSRSKLTVASFPSVTTIGNNAFFNCSNLATASFPAAISVGEYAFYNTKLNSLALFPNVVYISSNAFYSARFSEAIFPNAITVGSFAFQSCNYLTTLSLPKLTYAATRAFSGCEQLTSVSLPEVTMIADGAFSACRQIQSIYLPKLQYVSTRTFVACYSLNTLSLPMVSMIYQSAFMSCIRLSAVILNNEYDESKIVKLLDRNSFSSADNAIIYVPDSMVSSYHADPIWGPLSSRIKGLSELPS